jgi:hypothetical protein
VPKSALVVTFCAALALPTCARREEAPTRVSSEGRPAPMLLSHDAYITAIEQSLARIAGNARRVWIDGAGAVWLTSSELHSHRARRGNGFKKCPGEPTLWLDPPVRRQGERVDFHIVEAAGGRALGRVYEFSCSHGTCQLKDQYGTNPELIVLTCGTGEEFGGR